MKPNRRWVITGGCGFIGRSITARLLAQDGFDVRILDNLSQCDLTELEALHPVTRIGTNGAAPWDHKLTLMVGDITSSEDAMACTKGADVVVHLAANTGVAPSVADPMKDCKANVLGTLNMLEACRYNTVARLVFASSGAPLGVQVPPFHEELAAKPANPYGASKLAGEGYCSAYYQCFGVETVALRFGNVFGEGSGHKQSVVAKFIKSALAGEPIEIYGDGTQTRDFIYIRDLVNAVFAAATRPGVGGEVFQIAAAREMTVLELVSCLTDVFKEAGLPEPNISHAPLPQGDVARNFSDTSKAQSLLQWRPEYDIKGGLRQTLDYFAKSRT